MRALSALWVLTPRCQNTTGMQPVLKTPRSCFGPVYVQFMWCRSYPKATGALEFDPVTHSTTKRVSRSSLDTLSARTREKKADNPSEQFGGECMERLTEQYHLLSIAGMPIAGMTLHGQLSDDERWIKVLPPLLRRLETARIQA